MFCDSLKMNTVLLLLLIVLWCQFFIASPADVRYEATVKSRKKIECKHGFESVDIIIWKKNTHQIAYESKTESKILPQYELDKGEGISSLIIKKVHEEDAGTYTCIPFVAGTERTYKTITISLDVRGSGNMVKCSLTAIIGGFLVYNIFV